MGVPPNQGFGPLAGAGADPDPGGNQTGAVPAGEGGVELDGGNMAFPPGAGYAGYVEAPGSMGVGGAAAAVLTGPQLRTGSGLAEGGGESSGPLPWIIVGTRTVCAWAAAAAITSSAATKTPRE